MTCDGTNGSEMPDELEERLERALADLEPGSNVTERARAAALAALPARSGPRRPLLLLAAACAAAFVFGGVTLAATTGGLPLVQSGSASHDHGGQATGQRHRHRPGIFLPRGAIAFAAAADGRVWLAATSGTRLTGTRATAYELSPGAIWSVVGSPGTMRAVGVQQHGEGFRRAVTGTPLAAAWAPAGIRIAYVVRTPEGDRLHDMYGNGTHDFLVGRRVAPVRPSWRWDSQAFAYVADDGRVMIHNAISGSTSPLVRACGIRHATALEFAPFGGLLAIADDGGRVELVDTLHGRVNCRRGMAGTPAIAWVRPRHVIVGSGRSITHYDLYSRFAGADVTDTPGTVVGLAAGMDGRRLALALRGAGGKVHVVEARTPRFSEASHPLRLYRALADLGRVTGPVQLIWQ
jgi:hypothetical protein